MSERARLQAAMLGGLFWLAYPFAFWFGGGAKWRVRCAGRTFNGAFDDCFNDYLPVLDILIFPATLLLFYLFLRFAFILYAPPLHEREKAWWWLARHGGGADYHPSLQLFTGAAILWAMAHLAGYPLAWGTAPFILYWTAWIIWLGAGIKASWPVADTGA